MTEVLDDLPSTTTPHEPLQRLTPLVGDWTVTGPDGSSGQVSYEWMEGGGFLVQHVDLVQDGQRTRGVEYIGFEPTSGALRSRYFAANGEILEYVYELVDDTLTIWFGEVGSPARFTGTFDDGRSVNAGAWTWPGGRFASTMTRTAPGARPVGDR